MPYARIADLEAAVGPHELSQLTVDMPYAATLERALAAADATIDAYLAGRYALPLAHVPGILVGLACDIARYRLWRDAASTEVRRRFEDAQRYLERVADGRVRLVQDGAGAPDPGGVRFHAASPIFDARSGF